jgi:hypothetical protein
LLNRLRKLILEEFINELFQLEIHVRGNAHQHHHLKNEQIRKGDLSVELCVVCAQGHLPSLREMYRLRATRGIGRPINDNELC